MVLGAAPGWMIDERLEDASSNLWFWDWDHVTCTSHLDHHDDDHHHHQWWSWSSAFLYLDHQIHHKVCESPSLPVPSATYFSPIQLNFLLLLLNIWTSTYDNDSHLDIEESTSKQIKFFFSFPLQTWNQPTWGRDTVKYNFLKREI